MANRPEAYTIFEQGWIVHVQPPSDPNSRRVMLMLHGWTGNETVMSIFGRGVSTAYWLISPRGPVEASSGGFGWLPVESGNRTGFQEYAEVTDLLDLQVRHWLNYLNIATEKIDLMGFSQGGAMALSYLIRHPKRIARAACLAGFLPADAEEFLRADSLRGKSILIAHGTLDETVPIHLAERTTVQLRSAGAEVAFCREDVGHKLGPDCYKRLESFFG